MDKQKLLGWLDRTGDRMGNASDLLASALGTYLSHWLRFMWYGLIGLMAGAVLGDPLRIAGVVLGVVFVAEFSIALMTEFVDYKEVLVYVYVWAWWPWRNKFRSSPITNNDLPLDSKDMARMTLLMEVKNR